MPSKSIKQHNLMEAAAHTKGGYDGVPQKVGKEFAHADQDKRFAKGGKKIDLDDCKVNTAEKRSNCHKHF